MSLHEELENLDSSEVLAAFATHKARLDELIGTDRESDETEDISEIMQRDYPALFELVRAVANNAIADGVSEIEVDARLVGASQAVMTLKELGESELFPRID